MSVSERYLGILDADTPATISATSDINEAIRAMRKRRTLKVEKIAHNVPCLTRNDARGRIIYPVLGAGGEGYADLPHANERITISGERIPGSGHVWDRGLRNGSRDALRVTFSPYVDEGAPIRIGIFAHRPEDISWGSIGAALEGGLGCLALHAELSSVREDGTREMILLGENAGENALETLPFINAAASIMMGQVSSALQKGLGA